MYPETVQMISAEQAAAGLIGRFGGDGDVTYILNRAPFTRYIWNGSTLVGVPNFDSTGQALVGPDGGVASLPPYDGSSTWALRGTGSRVGAQKFITNIGPGGAFVMWDGTRWRPNSGRLLVSKNITARIIVGGTGATYSQTDTTVTVTWAAHGFTASLNNGSSVHLTQSTGALVTGWFTNFTYVDANTFTVTSTVSQSTSGNLGANTSETTILQETINGGLMGPDGTLILIPLLSYKSSASNKTYRAKMGGGTYTLNSFAATTVASAQSYISVRNIASGSRQESFNGGGSGTGLGTSSNAISIGAIDTSVDFTIDQYGQLASAADWMSVEGSILELVV